MISSGAMLSVIEVDPRRSENHNTALIRSVTPREIFPCSTRSDASRPR